MSICRPRLTDGLTIPHFYDKLISLKFCGFLQHLKMFFSPHDRDSGRAVLLQQREGTEREPTLYAGKPILPLLLSMALPMVVSMLVNSLYNIIDSLFVAK